MTNTPSTSAAATATGHFLIMNKKQYRENAKSHAKHERAEANSHHPGKLLEDMQRIAGDATLSPTGSCTRACYRKYGFYPASMIESEFGTFGAAQKLAGLKDSRTIASEKSRSARKAEDSEMRHAVISEFLPHKAEPVKIPKGVERIRVVTGSDFHGPECDPFALDVFMDTIKRQQPDMIVLNGDVYDFIELSRYSHNPNQMPALQEELDWVAENIFERVRKAAPKARIIMVIGNHEERLTKYLCDVAQPLAGLRCLSFGELLQLEKFGIELVFGDANIRPGNRTEFAEKGYLKVAHHIFTHGDSIGKHHTSDELRKWGGFSGTSGHTHRAQISTAPTLTFPHANWMSTPMMATKGLHGQHFVDIPERWDCGFGIVDIFPKEKLSQQTLILVGDHAVVDGIVYKRNK